MIFCLQVPSFWEDAENPEPKFILADCPRGRFKKGFAGSARLVEMLKHKLITCASLIVIIISIYGVLKTTFRVPQIKSMPTTTMATSNPSILLVPGTPGPAPTPELTQSTPPARVEPTPTPKPLKIRVVKHQPDQFRKGALGKEEIYAIKKALKTIQWSRNSDPKAAADEDYAAILKECRKSNLHYLLTDLITEAASNDYQADSEVANSTYIGELISDFETGVKDQREEQNPRSHGG
jgi:hypothetical protein